VFKECGSACPPNCTIPNPICTKQCVPRCECPRGTVINELTNKCVAVKSCPKGKISFSPKWYSTLFFSCAPGPSSYNICKLSGVELLYRAIIFVSQLLPQPVLLTNLLSTALWIPVSLLSVQLIPMPSVCLTSVEAAMLGSLKMVKRSLIHVVSYTKGLLSRIAARHKTCLATSIICSKAAKLSLSQIVLSRVRYLRSVGQPALPTVPLPTPSVPDSVYLAVSAQGALSSMNSQTSVFVQINVLCLVQVREYHSFI
jgi:hypothetical protein